MTTMSTPSESLRGVAETTADFGLRELMAVREIVHAFHTAGRPEEVYQLALDRVCPLVGATFACVYLVDEGSDLMRLVAVQNWPQRHSRFLGKMRVRHGFGPSGKAASERRMIEVLDVFADPTLEDWQEVAKELGFRALVALPLQTADRVLGTVTFYFASPNTLGTEMRHLLRMVADQMAATAEKARLIDDLQRANAALVESNVALAKQFAEAVEARRVKDEFLANISHELRTPLTAVMGYIALMRDGIAGPINEEQQRTLDQVKEASEELLSLIGDLIELTALRRGSIAAMMTDLDPRDPLHDAVASAKGRGKHVALEVSEPDLVPVMHSDRRTIAKALKALIDNAFKFTHDGRVRVSLQVTLDRAVYAVEDTGIGIPAAAHEAIFDEFRQLDGTLTREYGGSGLGLALARRLARLVQGDITLTSSPGTGSMFRLDVPLRYDTTSTPTPPSTPTLTA
jgi:signal transduction histidine kinase